MKYSTTIDAQEVAKFAQHGDTWWDLNGPFKTLHDINPARLEFIKQYVDLKDKSVLDLGCGGGILAEGLHYAGAKVTGLDVEQHAIETAKLHAKNNNLSINYVCQPVEEYTSNKFSVITCMEMLEHVLDPMLIIQHAKRLLLPGGFLFLSTINRTPKAYASVVLAAEYVLKLLPRQTHDYKKFIKPSELAKMLRQENCTMVGLNGLSYHPFSRSACLTSDVSGNYLVASSL